MTKTKLTSSEYTALLFLNNELESVRQKAQKIADTLEKYKKKSAEIDNVITTLNDLASFDLEDSFIDL